MNLENSNLLVRWQILHFLFNNQADAMNLKSSIVILTISNLKFLHRLLPSLEND